MFKKIIFSFLLIFSLVEISAQHVPGSWKVIPMSGSTIETVQDTPSRVYYLSGGALYSYDKDNSETIYYAPGLKISDNGIKFIKYNPDNKYLAVIYKNGNIDLIYDNGKVVNLPEIKDANITLNKTVNNVQFGKDRMYIATSFGIVVYDDKNHYVLESGIYEQNIPFVFELGDYVMLVNNSQYLMYSPKKDRHNSISKFKSVSQIASKDNIYPLSDDAFIMLANSNVYKITVNFGSNTINVATLQAVPGAKSLNRYKNGFYVPSNDGFYIFNSDGSYASKSSYTSEYGSQNLSFWNSPASVWGGDAKGIANYDLSSSSPAVLSEKYFPEASRQYRTWYRVNDPNGEEVYISECHRSEVFPNVSSSSNDFWGSPILNESYNWSTGKIIPQYAIFGDGTIITNGSSRIIFDPNDPSYKYMAHMVNGLVILKDNVYYYNYDHNNSPINTLWYANAFDVAFDNLGNLWVYYWRLNGDAPGSKNSPMKVLSKENLELIKTSPSKLTETTKDAAGNIIDYPYWMQPDWVPGYVGRMDAKLVFSSKALNKGIAGNGEYHTGVVGIDTKNTSDVKDDTYQAYPSFQDQDGTVTSPLRIVWLEEDKKTGDIWMGTDMGVYVIKDLNQIADKSSNYLNVVRPKVARNDGTNYADYLLSGDFIMNIAMDSQNRKWIATSTSGLYCVSADGTQIIHEFNKDNSPMVSNVVTMVACDPNGNDVLIGTPEGLYVYSSESSPAKADYSEVYAYPNPVRPDYTGWITINGLMDNSLVKITDAQGSLVWQGRSEGGMAVWDGCDSAGNRVHSGVYMVFASQNADGKSSGAVTKIVVIN